MHTISRVIASTRKMSSYTRPTTPRNMKTVYPRELRPLGEPPAALLLYPPVLSPRTAARVKEQNPIFEDFVLSTHVMPAAYPRTAPYISPSTLAPSGERKPADKDARKAWEQSASDVIWKTSIRQVRGELSGGERRLLWNCVNRYARQTPAPKGKKSITLFLAHANGFPKEVRSCISYCQDLFGSYY